LKISSGRGRIPVSRKRAARSGKMPIPAPAPTRLRKHAAAHRGSAATRRVGAAGRRNQSGRRREVELIASKWGKSWLFGSRGDPARHAQGSGVGTNARKMANGRNGGILVRSRESKMEIPVNKEENAWRFDFRTYRSIKVGAILIVSRP